MRRIAALQLSQLRQALLTHFNYEPVSKCVLVVACSVRREDSPTGGSLQLLSAMSARSTTPDYLSPLCASTRGTTEKLCAWRRKGIWCLTFAEVNEHWGSLSVLWYVMLRKTYCCCWTDSNVTTRPVSLWCIHVLAWAHFWAEHWRVQHFKD
jgi:hypothetical protein